MFNLDVFRKSNFTAKRGIPYIDDEFKIIPKNGNNILPIKESLCPGCPMSRLVRVVDGNLLCGDLHHNGLKDLQCRQKRGEFKIRWQWPWWF